MTGLGYLGTPTSGIPTSYAYGINDLALIVGSSTAPAASQNQAFSYANNAMTALSGLGPQSQARDVNANGDVAGFGSTYLNSPNQAFLRTNGGSVTWLGSMHIPASGGSPTSYAYGINDAAEVVGYSSSPQFNYEAFIWSSTQGMRAIGDLAGGIYYSIAYGINNSAQVVGTSISSIIGSYEAFVWDAVQGMVSLNTLVDGASGWVLREARAINNNGQIVGYGQNPSGGREAFLLTPATPSAPMIAFNPASVAFSAVAGGANPADQALNISNASVGTLTWAVSTTAGWLTPNPLSGQQSGTVTLSVNTAGLAAGTYASNIVITGNASNSPQSVPVTLTVSAPPPTIGFTPASLSWTVDEGSAISAKQQLGVTNTGGGTMMYSAVGDQSWMRISPSSGFVSSGVYAYNDVSVDATGKTAGTYSGNIVITGPGATNTPQSVPVTMTVNTAPPAPAIAFSPASFTFTGTAGGANPANQTLNVSNSHTGTLNWTVTSTAAWLSPAPASGQQSGTVTLSVSVAGLAAGTYTTNVEIAGNAANSPQSVPVTLTLNAAPTIGFTPASLSWTINEGSTTSAKQQLAITNTGSGTLVWSAAGSQTWIGVTPTSGFVSSGAFSYADVTVNPTGKTAGAYSGNVVITGFGANNTPQSVPVTMTVNPAITVTYPNGGETLHYTKNVTVTWNVNTPGQTVSKTSTLYSTNGGSTWTLIKTQTGLATSCAWKVPNLAKASANCLVRVQFKTAAGAVIAQDQSDSVFTITK